MTRLLMTTDAVGGVWQYANELTAALRPSGIETVLAVLGPKPALANRRADKEAGSLEVIHTGLPLDWLANGPEAVLVAGEAVAGLARRVGADIVHLNSPTLAARAVFPVPVVAVAHGCVATWWQASRGGSPDAGYAWHGELMGEGLRAADAVVAPSAAFAATLQQAYDLPSTPLVVHNGRTPPVVDEDVPQADHVFTAGRLWDEVKNTPLLDRVAARLPVPFRAAGPLAGPQGEAMGVDHLQTLGAVDEGVIARELAGRPVYVSAASFEPFGLSVLEAAAAGCPLVLSNVDTFRELWTGAALIVPDQDEDAYLAAIGRVLTDPDLRAHLGEAARLRSARYTPAAMASSMAAIYAGLATPHAERVAA